MPNPYEIPWKPLDFSGIAEIPQLYMAARKASADIDLAKQNAETQREYANNAQRRMSSQEYRDQQEFEARRQDREQKRAMEQGKALPMILRAMRRSQAEGQALGQAYGVDISPDQTQSDALAQPDFMRPQLLQAAGNASGLGQASVDQEDNGNAVLEFPDQTTEIVPSLGGLHPMREDESLPIEGPQQFAQPPSVEAPQAPTATPPSSYSINIGGKKFTVPMTANTGSQTGLGPEYDDLYERILDADPTADPRKVFGMVLGEKQKADAIRSREGQAEAGRDLTGSTHMTVEQQQEALRQRLAQSETNTRIMAQSRVAAAAPGIKQEGVNLRAMGELDRRFENVKRTTGWTKLQQEDRNVRSVFTNIADGTVPLQHRDAQVALARIFRQAQPTEGEMRLLYDHLGGTMDKWEQFKAKISTGDLSLEQLRQLKASSIQVKREHDEAVKRTFDAAKHSFAGFENMADNVNEYVRGAFADLGEDVPDVFPGNRTGITLGTGEAPKHRAVKGKTVKIRSKSTGEIKEVSEDEARAMGAIK